MTKEKILEKALEVLGDKGKLLYLTKFGSHLYGTDSPTSDTDVKGIFLPTLESLVMGDFPKSINFTSGSNGSKNTKEDIDIELWSIQYFIKLLKQAETTALDLYFSWTNPDAVISMSQLVKDFFVRDFDKLIETNNIMKCAYVKYAVSQAKKYGIKGTRVGILKRISQYDYNYDGNQNEKLGDIADKLLEKFEDPSFFFSKEIGGVKSLVVCGKVHQYTIKTTEFFERINGDYKRYGERAKLAEANEGIDWKALSHAIRAIFQMEQLVQYGYITFPLAKHETTVLKNVKFGKVKFDIVEEIITTGIEGLDALVEKSKLNYKFNDEYVRRTVKLLYNL